MNKPNLAKFFGDARLAIEKHSPEILLGIGIAGMITTTVLAVRATPRALVRIEEKKQELHEDQLTPVETIKATWKCYIPVIVTGVTSTACLIGSHSVQARRTAAFATAYKLSETALTEYREKVVKTLGEKKEKTIREEIAGDKVDQYPVSKSTVYVTNTGSTLCLDPLAQRYFTSDINRIKKVQNDLNERMLTDVFGYVSLNDFYTELGLDPIDIGYDIGWSVSKGKIDIDFGSRLTDEGQPCLVLEYQVAPQWGYDKY